LGLRLRLPNKFLLHMPFAAQQARIIFTKL
jgi:hypothetical protein